MTKVKGETLTAVAPTDINWFKQLSTEETVSEINFWTPTPWNVKRLKKGDRFYFLLKSPYRKICGYGHFKNYLNLSTKEAWNKFGRGNGVKSREELVERATGYATRHSNKFIPTEDPIIGCIILTNPIFFSEDEFVIPNEMGLEFPPQVVKLKYFNIDPFLENNKEVSNFLETFSLVQTNKKNYKSTTIKNRIGQSIFRNKVLEAYSFKCAITGENCLEIIQAAHIQGYINEESNHPQNGIPLRIDFHNLFDLGLITITCDYEVLVSALLNSEYYQTFNKRKILLPKSISNFPSKQALEEHNRNVFRGEILSKKSGTKDFRK